DAPYLTQAFKQAGVPAQVLDALRDAQKEESQEQQCLAEGAEGILRDQLNAASGAALTNPAVRQGAKGADDARLVVGSKASYCGPLDSVRVGKLQGQGLVKGLQASGASGTPVVARLNGGIADNNAKLFKQGYGSILDPLFANGQLKPAT